MKCLILAADILCCNYIRNNMIFFCKLPKVTQYTASKPGIIYQPAVAETTCAGGEIDNPTARYSESFRGSANQILSESKMSIQSIVRGVHRFIPGVPMFCECATKR